MQFHPIGRRDAVDHAAAGGLCTDSSLPHVAQQSRRDKLRFPPASSDVARMLPPPYGYDNDAAFPPPPDPYDARASAADLGYLHAVVAPPLAPPADGGDQWPMPQHSGPPWAHPKLEQVEMEYEAARAGFTAHHQGAALSLALHSPAYGGSLQSVVGAAAAAAGPLGPFTGYAAVLKRSRFLRPAQQMLDEICAALVGEERSRWNAGAGWSCSLTSPTSLSSSSEDGNRQHLRPEFREMKAKLLFMQEEVCRRYKQYHHHMQMVVSSFDSVPGLSSSTPYASSILKAISGRFRRVRSIISNQIQYISSLLGDELLSLPSCSGGGKAVAEKSQPVWRPHRGLPESAVSVLRAWLFEHFLHPYPTDGDKHMLATQTGLSRNQVSNWFINARVRLWKPMVEEIHMLETRVSASTNSKVPSSSGRVTPPVGLGSQQQQQFQMLQDQHQCQDAAPPQMGVEVGGGGQGPMSFGGGVGLADMGGGFGAAAAVSLTLGLRRDVSYQYQQQLGGHILGDLVG